jgi:hypothetical protein
LKLPDDCNHRSRRLASLEIPKRVESNSSHQAVVAIKDMNVPRLMIAFEPDEKVPTATFSAHRT